MPILEYSERITRNHGTALVLWIHGIKDQNISGNVVNGNPGEIHAVLGIGQGNNDGFTPDQSSAARLIICLRDNAIKQIDGVLAKKESNYSGSHENTMNQLFVRKHYGLLKVQSFQLKGISLDPSEALQ